MHEIIQRASMLMTQNRLDLAEKELRRGLAEAPHEATLHAMLAVVISHDGDRLTEATTEAKQSVALAPDDPFTHYALCEALVSRNHFKEARKAIEEAIRLDPYDADYFVMLAKVEVASQNWQPALDAVEQALALEPDDSTSLALRSIALERLGRADEALDAAKQNVQADPDDSWSHASYGWAALNSGKHEEAATAFREALRLEPNNEMAREGMISAINSRNFLFRLIHRFHMMLSRLSQGNQFFFIFGIWLAMQVLTRAARQVPMLEPFVLPLVLMYFAFVVLTWTADSVFNAFLRFHPFGKHLLRPKELRQSNLVGACLICAVLGAIYATVTLDLFAGITVMFYWMLMCAPVTIPFAMPTVARTVFASLAAVFIALIPVVGIYRSVAFDDPDAFTSSFQLFCMSVLGMQILGNLIAMAPNRK